MHGKNIMTRREAVKRAALAAAGVWAWAAGAEEHPKPPFQLGVASYSLARFSPDEVIAVLNDFNYAHIVSFEFEKHDGDVAQGLGESIRYVRQLLG